MRIDLYHIDAFEAANYEPIWRSLRAKGVDARMVAVPGRANTAESGWFDIDRFHQTCRARGVDWADEADPRALGVTTQNIGILADYGQRVRLMYGPAPYDSGWAMQRHAVQPFDAVLVHGRFQADWFARWLRPDQLPVIGYPRYDDFFAGRVSRAAARARWQLADDKPVLAFLPTWDNNTAFDTLWPAIEALRDRCQILLRPHHCTLRMEPARMQRLRDSGLPMLDQAFDLTELIVAADLVVSDVRSGSLFEAAMCGLPTVGLVRADSGDAEGWLARQRVGELMPLASQPDQVAAAVDQALAGGAYTAARARWAEHNVAHRDGSAASQAAEALIALATPRRVQVSLAASPTCKVSVVLPTYNHADFLPQAVQCVLAQSLADFELIIVNDGSTDSTASWLATLRDPRVRIIHRDNGGLPTALNTGFAAARGTYRTWTSADNQTAPTWLERLVGTLDQAPPHVGFACSGFGLVDGQGRFHSIRRGQNLALDSLVCKNPGIASFLYRGSLADEVGDYNPALKGAEDWDMWLRLMERCDPVVIDDVLYHYRQHDNSMTRSMPGQIRQAEQATLEDLRQRHGNGFDLNRFYPRLHLASDRPLARWQARGRLATALTPSPFVPPNWVAQLYIDALRERFSADLHANFIVLLVRAQAWDMALASCDQVRALHPAPAQLDQIRTLVAARDTSLLQRLPLRQLPESALAFALGRG